MSKIIESDCGNVTVLAGDDIENSVGVTESAKQKITELLKTEEDGSFLRVGVSSGGCSGFQYVFGIHNEKEEDDFTNEWDGGSLVVDSVSMQYMKGATLDFIKEISGEFFSVNNPGATSYCGCQSSFSYDDPDF